MDLYKHIYMDADTGLDAVIPQAEPESTPAEKAEETKPEAPAWLSQLPKEMRENKDVADRISGYKTIADLANAFIKADDDGKTALHVPTKDSTPEQVKDFFKKWGVPETPGDYNLSDYDIDPESIKKSKELFMAAAHKSALTKRQAENMWMSEVAMYKAVSQLRAEADQKVKDAFEPQYSKLLEAEYPEESERKKVIKEELAVVTKWTQEQGIAKKLVESGLVYDAEVMHKLAGYIKSNSAGGFVQGKKAPEQQRPSGGMFDNYSQAFLDAVGR